MKKAVLILAVLVVFSTLAFASPSVSFGIWGRTVFNAAVGNSGAGSRVQQFWGPDWAWGTTERIDLTFITDPAEFSFRFNFNRGNILFFSLDNMFGTLKFIPDLLTVRVGRFTGDGFDAFRRTSNRDINNDNIGRMAGVGIWLSTAPKDTGFEATVFYKTNSDKWTNAVPVNTGTGNFNITANDVDAVPLDLIDNLMKTGVNVAYTLPGLLKISAGSLTNGSYASGSPDGAQDIVRNIWLRAEPLMIQNVKVWFDAYVVGLFEPEAVSPATGISAFVGSNISMDALSLELDIGYKLAMLKTANPLLNNIMTLNIWPEVAYNLGDVTVALDATVGVVFPIIIATDTTVINVNVTPSVKLNKFNTTAALSLDFSSAPGALINWKIPLTVDFSMW